MDGSNLESPTLHSPSQRSSALLPDSAPLTRGHWTSCSRGNNCKDPIQILDHRHKEDRQFDHQQMREMQEEIQASGKTTNETSPSGTDQAESAFTNVGVYYF